MASKKTIPNRATVEPKVLRVGAYARVSTTNQLLEFDSSIDTQIQKLRRRAQYENEQAGADGQRWEIVEEYREEGRSGKNTDRPELQRLLKDVREGRLDAVVVVKIDRITRSLTDFYDLWNTFEEHNVEFTALDDKFDTTSATGRAMLKITLVFAELERERTSERTKEKIQSRRAAGLWFGGRVPFGYSPHATNKTTLEVDSVQAKQLRVEIFEKFLELGSARAVAKHLSRRGIKRAKSPFTTQTVLNVLSDQRYVARREVAGKTIVCEWPQLIDVKLFERVQSKLAANSVERPKRRGVNSRLFLLEGLLRCSACGSSMTRASGTGRNGAHFYYRCSLRHRTASEGCKTRDVPASAVENFVIEQLMTLSIDEQALKTAVREANEGRDETLRGIDAELKKVNAALTLVGKTINGLLDGVESGGREVPALVARLQKKQDEQGTLKSEQSDLQTRRQMLTQKMLDAEVVSEGYRKLPKLLQRAKKADAAEDLREVLREVVDVVEWAQDPESERKGEARIRLFELPRGFWSTDAVPESFRPSAPPLSGSLGRQQWLPE